MVKKKKVSKRVKKAIKNLPNFSEKELVQMESDALKIKLPNNYQYEDEIAIKFPRIEKATIEFENEIQDAIKRLKQLI